MIARHLREIAIIYSAKRRNATTKTNLKNRVYTVFWMKRWKRFWLTCIWQMPSLGLKQVLMLCFRR